MHEVPTGGVPRPADEILFRAHDGKGPPEHITPHSLVDIRLRSGELRFGLRAEEVRWAILQLPDDVTAWRRCSARVRSQEHGGRSLAQVGYLDHDGRGVPGDLEPNELVDVMFHDGQERHCALASELRWTRTEGIYLPGDIVHWRRSPDFRTGPSHNEIIDSRVRKHSHYFRDVSHLDTIDIYRLLELFNVTDQALGHAIKKLIVPGMRGGGKPARKDIEEAVDTLKRRLEMLDEDCVEKAN